jgi:CMP-N,N'-diacetyllegionaminic acid synthase
MKILGLITARGGSKGIPGKNIKSLDGKPLIAYTIESAKQSGIFDRLILTTDDEEIAAVAREYGCEVPFMRPSELATDTTAHVPVMRHALEWLRGTEGYAPECVALLQPTSPLRQAFHLKEAAEKLMGDNAADSIVSVRPVPERFNSGKTMRLNGAYLRTICGKPVYERVPRRQDLHEEYTTAGLLILIFKAKLLLGEKPNLYGEKTLPYMIDEKYVIDINEPEDWHEAEQALRALRAS